MSDNDDYSNSKSANLETIDDKTADDPNVETIEKVLKARVGRVGGKKYHFFFFLIYNLRDILFFISKRKSLFENPI